MRGWLRAGLGLLAAAQAVAGLVQLFLPSVFFFDFPWVALLPPYNEHLMRDVGALSLALALMLGMAAVRPEPVLVRTALAAVMMFAVPHFVFHALHLAHYPLAGAITQTLVLAIVMVIPAALLGFSWFGGRARRE
jgi:hypothetical protein